MNLLGENLNDKLDIFQVEVERSRHLGGNLDNSILENPQDNQEKLDNSDAASSS